MILHDRSINKIKVDLIDLRRGQRVFHLDESWIGGKQGVGAELRESVSEIL